MSGPRMVRARRAATGAFIAVCLATQVLQNLGVPYLPLSGTGAPERAVVSVANQARWVIEQFGFWTATNTYWRMFSPVHRYDWWWQVAAVAPDGSERDLTTPSAPERTGLQGLLVDFRETKLLMNLWTREPMQAAYLDHRCRDELANGRPAASVKLVLHWRPILPPHEALARGEHRSTERGTALMAQRSCGA